MHDRSVAGHGGVGEQLIESERVEDERVVDGAERDEERADARLGDERDGQPVGAKRAECRNRQQNVAERPWMNDERASDGGQRRRFGGGGRWWRAQCRSKWWDVLRSR
jgi:hypothetical protein